MTDTDETAVSDMDDKEDTCADDVLDAGNGSKTDSDGEDVASLNELRAANIQALLDNSLQVCRKPMLSKILTVKEAEAVLRKPFRTPQPGASSCSDALKRKLLARRRFVAWGDSKPFVAPLPQPKLPDIPVNEPEGEEVLPEGIEPLVLWDPADAGGEPVVVDNMLTKFLRPHQREGVQFMFECVMGLRLPDSKGCILADDMGLGKTLQGIALMWTLLRSGHEMLGGKPIAKRTIIVCPTSLVSNWDSECIKWLKGKVRTLPLCESSREDVISSIAQFHHPSNVFQVLIISYETFRLHSERFRGPEACDLLICDEAHRLKNDSTLTNRALDSLECKRRVLLSGTPMQNHLDEFYAMVDFCNPGVLGSPAEFRKRFESPILASREPGATEDQVALGDERSAELSTIVNNFIMRRTNKLLSQHLPPKVVEVVCCTMTPLQQSLYCHFLQSNAARKLLSGAQGKAAGVLSAITSLKKLCNHPKLIYDAIHSKADEALPDGFEGVGELFPPGVFDNGRPGRGGLAMGWELLSGKMAVAARMLHIMYTETDDRIVIVSNYTQTLDLFANLCRERSYPFLRLDGSTSINKRQKLVKAFNDKQQKQFVFLLSSKAGGCGLNLIGGNRLILFDPDWNPANDKQAAARVWRDGQNKRVYVYRFLTTGTIEEKVFQRQVSKEGLQSLVSSKNGKAASNLMSAEELRDLFTLRPDTLSDTYDSMTTPSPGDPIAVGPDAGEPTVKSFKGMELHRPQIGAPAEDDIKNWGQHSKVGTVPDQVMQKAAGDQVTFVFTCEVAGKQLEEDQGPVTPHHQVHQGPRLPGQRSTPASTSNQRHSAPAPGSTPRDTAPLRHGAVSGSVLRHSSPVNTTASQYTLPQASRLLKHGASEASPATTPTARLLPAPSSFLPATTAQQTSSTGHTPSTPYTPQTSTQQPSRLSNQKRPLQQLDANRIAGGQGTGTPGAGPLQGSVSIGTMQKKSRLSVSSKPRPQNAQVAVSGPGKPVSSPIPSSKPSRVDDDDFM